MFKKVFKMFIVLVTFGILFMGTLFIITSVGALFLGEVSTDIMLIAFIILSIGILYRLTNEEWCFNFIISYK